LPGKSNSVARREIHKIPGNTNQINPQNQSGTSYEKNRQFHLCSKAFIMKLQISLIAVLIILTFISCQHSQSQDSNMAGSYAYKKPSMIEGAMMVLRGKTKQLVSPKLNLEENNTFSFSTCGCSTEGVWKSGKDTILLQHHVVNYQEGISKC